VPLLTSERAPPAWTESEKSVLGKGSLFLEELQPVKGEKDDKGRVDDSVSLLKPPPPLLWLWVSLTPYTSPETHTAIGSRYGPSTTKRNERFRQATKMIRTYSWLRDNITGLAHFLFVPWLPLSTALQVDRDDALHSAKMVVCRFEYPEPTTRYRRQVSVELALWSIQILQKPREYLRIPRQYPCPSGKSGELFYYQSAHLRKNLLDIVHW
jgi:hypothetical protein